MHIVHSVIRIIAADHQATNEEHGSSPGNEITLRYQAYQTACRKYSLEIAAIQKYLPGWMPEFR